MGTYDVTLSQYCQFLNAVAATDTYGCYNSNMAGGGYYQFGIGQTGSPGNFAYSVTGANPKAANMPVYFETWGDAALLQLAVQRAADRRRGQWHNGNRSVPA